MTKPKKKQSQFFIWEQSGPGIRKLSDDAKSIYQWYRKRKKK